MKLYILYDSGFNFGAYDLSEQFEIMRGVFTSKEKAEECRNEVIRKQYSELYITKDGEFTTFEPELEENDWDSETYGYKTLDYDDWKYDVYIEEIEADCMIEP